MDNLSITDIECHMANTCTVTVEYQIARLKIADRYRCTYSSLNTCPSWYRISKVQIYLLCKSGTIDTTCQTVAAINIWITFKLKCIIYNLLSKGRIG